MTNSKWNPGHWKQYNEYELLEFRTHLKDHENDHERDPKFEQWRQEIDSVLTNRQSDQSKK